MKISGVFIMYSTFVRVVKGEEASEIAPLKNWGALMMKNDGNGFHEEVFVTGQSLMKQFA